VVVPGVVIRRELFWPVWWDVVVAVFDLREGAGAATDTSSLFNANMDSSASSVSPFSTGIKCPEDRRVDGRQPASTMLRQFVP
jgi:hypothetical protein